MPCPSRSVCAGAAPLVPPGSLVPLASPIDKRREHCGVLGVLRGSGPAAPLVHRGLLALQHRGQEGAGIVSVDDSGQLHSLRGRGLVVSALPIEDVHALPGRVAIGHVRYSTVAVDHAENLQPFFADTPLGRFAIAHNGNFKNAPELAAELAHGGAVLSTTMDTELFLHLAARAGSGEIASALRHAAERVVGAYSLALLIAGRLFGLRDPHGVRPLVIGRLLSRGAPDGWVLASETCALAAIGARYVREVAPGELVELGPQGLVSTQLVAPRPRPAPCVFELVYFARPDSQVFSQSVYEARVRMGEELAAQDDTSESGPIAARADLVVPVPDSGVPAALGYARKSGLPFEPAILRSRFVGRTFILPDQDARSHAVQLKLSVVPAAVAGRRVVLVDDSLVRGSTARPLVQLVREAGAAAVFLRIASPPIREPCYLGIDTPIRDELLINRAFPDADGEHRGLEAVRRYLNVDDLRYLEQDGLHRATRQRPFCTACMDGDYPV
ncbi:MAG: amidophosphoribosyltransferase [Polyangia bacterium]